MRTDYTKWWTLIVTYSLGSRSWGSLDDHIEKLSRGVLSGSGTGFGERDISILFKTKRGAEGGAKRIKAQRWRGVRCSIMAPGN